MAVKTTDPMPNHQKKLKKKRLQSSQQHKDPVDNSENLSSSAAISANSNKLKLVAQELKFAKLLAGNDARISQKQLAKLQKWLKIRSQSSYPFEDQDFLRIWKGLFYGMWMCDKPLPQEKMADDLAALIHCFNNPDISIQFFGAFLQTINKEWFGIDQWRIDKFMMLVRRATRQILVVLRGVGNNLEYYQRFGKCLENTILSSDVSMGFFMHFTELLMEEVAKVFDGNIENEIVTSLVKPFATFIAKPKNWKLSKHVVKNVFNFLLFQSDLGREYQEKFEAWKHMGFPGQSINDLEMVNDSDQEEAEAEEEVNSDEGSNDDDNDEEMTDQNPSEKPLDPRAGRVNVVMPEITFNPMDIVNIFDDLLTKKFTNVKSRQTLKRIINQYKTFANGEFPIGIRKMWTNKANMKLPKIDDKVNELINFENKLLTSTKQIKKLNKKKRRKHLQTGAKLPLDDLSSTNNIKRRRRIKSFSAEEKRIIKTWQEEDITTVANKIERNSKKLSSPASPPRIKVTPATPTVSEVVLTPPKRTDKQKTILTNDNSTSFIADNVQSPSLRSTTTAIQSYDTAIIAKQQAALKELSAAANLVVNPAAIRSKKLKKTLLIQQTQSAPVTPISTQKKRVKIMLKLNSSQDTNEYIQQLRSSPNVPYDADKKPTKSLLKANLMPSPINPYYKKKIGLNF